MRLKVYRLRNARRRGDETKEQRQTRQKTTRQRDVRRRADETFQQQQK